ncbi:MAG: thiol-disulfide oxidoreductase DCC family protein [Saprospiraceae bacterium]
MKVTLDLATYPHPILLYDGVCTFCNAAAQFILQRDPEGVIHYASLQSELGQNLLDHFQLSKDLDTVILIENNQTYDKTDVTIRIGQHLGGVYKIANLLRLFPKSMRNRVYDWIARNRYNWFGKKETCPIPTADVRARFLDV